MPVLFGEYRQRWCTTMRPASMNAVSNRSAGLLHPYNYSVKTSTAVTTNNVGHWSILKTRPNPRKLLHKSTKPIVDTRQLKHENKKRSCRWGTGRRKGHLKSCKNAVQVVKELHLKSTATGEWPSRIQGHLRSLVLVPFDKPHMISYSFFLVIHCKYISILYRFRDINTNLFAKY